MSDQLSFEREADKYLSLWHDLAFTTEVAVAVGRATISWNNVSYSVFQLFHLLTEMDEEAAKCAFFAVSSDRSQRDMVSNLISARLHSQNSTLAKKAQSTLGEINKIAGKRNDILHVVLIDELDPTAVRQYHERGHLKGKLGLDLVTSIQKVATDCLDTSLDLLRITKEIRNLPYYRRKSLADGLRLYSAQRNVGILAGLLGVDSPNEAATIPSSPSPARDD